MYTSNSFDGKTSFDFDVSDLSPIVTTSVAECFYVELGEPWLLFRSDGLNENPAADGEYQQR